MYVSPKVLFISLSFVFFFFRDEDMQSVVSLMSVNNNCDVAPLDDLEDIPDLENSADISDHLYDFTQQLEQMTTSLNGCMDLPTPLSGKSFSVDFLLPYPHHIVYILFAFTYILYKC